MTDRPSRVGTIVDQKYELVRLLGRGGMGEVYEARHRHIGRRVALKFLLPQAADSAEIVARFMNEARAAGALEHENIAAVYDVGQAEGTSQYIVMEYLEGEDCDRLLTAQRILPQRRAIGIVAQVCRGLSVAHAHGIIHRDLKPANLFVTRRADGSDLVKILDFGIAKLRAAADAAQRTNTGAALGTPYYMSPEQARGDRDVDTRTDLYALGVILYELLSGKRPFEGETPLQILHRIVSQPPTPLQQVQPGLPNPLYGVVHRAIDKRPDQRYSTVADFAAALATMGGEEQLTASREIAPFAATAPAAPTTYAPVHPAEHRSAAATPDARVHTPSQPAPVQVVVNASHNSSPGLSGTWGASGVFISIALAILLVALGAGAVLMLRPDASSTLTTDSPEGIPSSSPSLAPSPKAESVLPHVAAPVSSSASGAMRTTTSVVQGSDRQTGTLPTVVRGHDSVTSSNQQTRAARSLHLAATPPSAANAPTEASRSSSPSRTARMSPEQDEPTGSPPVCERLLERQSLGETLTPQEKTQLLNQCHR